MDADGVVELRTDGAPLGEWAELDPPGTWASVATTDAGLSADAGVPASAGDPASADSEPVPVTRLAENSVDAVQPDRVLLAGTDTLDFGVYCECGRSWCSVARKLAKLKQRAQRGDPVLLDGGRCLMLAGGKPNYPFHLRYPGFHIWLSRHQAPQGDTPNVFVSLNAQTLWLQGESAAVEAALDEVRGITGGTVQTCRVSRADLAADLVLANHLTEAGLRDLAVTRTSQCRVFYQGDVLQTMYVGAAGAPVSLRVYDKSEEIRVNGKDWFLPLWGVSENEHVWRVEFQLRRPFLKSAGVNCIDDWQARQADIWAYLTAAWFSLREHDNANASRRSVTPFWELVQDCAERFGRTSDGLRRQARAVSPRVEPIVKQAASLLVGLGTRLGENDVEGALDSLVRSLREEFASRNFANECQRKAIRLGLVREEAAA